MWSGFIGATWRRKGVGGNRNLLLRGSGSLPGKNFEIGVLKSAFQCILSNHGFVLLLKKSNFTEKNIRVMYCVD